MADQPGDAATRRKGPFGPVRKAIELWALAGGLLLVAVVLMNVYSLAAGYIVGKPLPGDFEMVEIGVAVAAFAFLPYCQLTGAHVSADVFTQGAGPRLKAALALFAAGIGLAVSAILLWRMSLGLGDQIGYGETTAIMSIPIWWAYVPIVASLALFVVAAVVTLIDALAEMRQTAH